MYFEVFGYRMKNSFECLLCNQMPIFWENQVESPHDFVLHVIKIPYQNFHFGADFYSFIIMMN